MSNNFNKIIESLSSLSGADLDDLKDEINDEIKRREHKQVIELKEKAIQALRDFFNAGGYVMNNEDNYNWGIDEALLAAGDENCIYLK